MNYIKLPYIDSEVSIFAVCQAHQQLESDYNVSGMLRERSSNQRRNASTGVQLHRMGYSNSFGRVDILNPELDDYGYEDSEESDVRDIYLINVLKYGLPMDAKMRVFIAARFNHAFIQKITKDAP